VLVMGFVPVGVEPLEEGERFINFQLSIKFQFSSIYIHSLLAQRMNQEKTAPVVGS
jgi:hypothetical protein